MQARVKLGFEGKRRPSPLSPQYTQHPHANSRIILEGSSFPSSSPFFSLFLYYYYYYSTRPVPGTMIFLSSIFPVVLCGSWASRKPRDDKTSAISQEVWWWWWWRDGKNVHECLWGISRLRVIDADPSCCTTLTSEIRLLRARGEKCGQNLYYGRGKGFLLLFFFFFFFLPLEVSYTCADIAHTFVFMVYRGYSFFFFFFRINYLWKGKSKRGMLFGWMLVHYY